MTGQRNRLTCTEKLVYVDWRFDEDPEKHEYDSLEIVE